MKVYRQVLHQSRRIHSWEAIFLFFFVLTLISSHYKTDATYQPPFSTEVLNKGFVAWLIFHKIWIATLLLYISYITRNGFFLVVSGFAYLEIPEVLIFYDQPWFRIFDIPICCDTFELSAFTIMAFKQIIKHE